jgi:hypothetical protein
MFLRNFLMILASLALCTGCPSDPIDNPQDTSTQVDGGGNDGGGDTSNSDTPTWQDVDLQFGEGYALITAKTPDNKPATFYVCNQCPNWVGGNEEDPSDPCRNLREPNPSSPNNTQIFKDVAELNFPTKASIEFGYDYTVCVERQNHLFIPFKFNLKGAKNPQMANAKNCEWKDTGSWGLAPNGTYISSDGTKKKTFETSVKNGKVLMTGVTGDIPDGVPITNNTWTFEDTNIISSGTISEDLSTVSYSFKGKATGKEFSGTVMKQ